MSTKNAIPTPSEKQDNSPQEDTAADDTKLGLPEMNAEDTSKKLIEEQPEENRKFYNIISTF